MPLSKSIASYPYSFFELTDTLSELRESISLTFVTPLEARQFRQQLYGFAGALEKLGQEGDDTMMGKARVIRSVEVRMSGSVLTFVSRFDSVYAKAATRLAQMIRNSNSDTDTDTVTDTVPVTDTKADTNPPDEMQSVLDQLGYTTSPVTVTVDDDTEKKN